MNMITNRLLEFRIRKPNDSGESWEVQGEIQSIGNDNSLLLKVGRTRYTASPNRVAKDPILGGITEMFRQMLQVRRRRRRSYRTEPNQFKGILKIISLSSNDYSCSCV